MQVKELTHLSNCMHPCGYGSRVEEETRTTPYLGDVTDLAANVTMTSRNRAVLLERRWSGPLLIMRVSDKVWTRAC